MLFSPSLSKARQTLVKINALYKAKWKDLRKEEVEELEVKLHLLEEAIFDGEKQKAANLCKELKNFARKHLKKSPFEHIKEFSLAISIALCIATVLRQMWFEPMEIPTGSMRPTFKEQDRLVVSKSTFGLNIPLRAAHLSFHPDFLKRGDIFIFRPENMDIKNSNTSYFGLPGKKRFIKRCMGKAGDRLYFYGGKIYGIDKDGNDLKELREAPFLEKIEHIPFLHFEGKILATAPNARGLYSPVFYYHFNQLLAKHSLLSNRKTVGEIYHNKQWKREVFPPAKSESPQAFCDFFGIKNYAMARILSERDVQADGSYASKKNLKKAPLYLELQHHPSLSFPAPRFTHDELGRLRPGLSNNATLLALDEELIERMMQNLYTARFVVKDGFACSYSMRHIASKRKENLPEFKDVPNGTYEFYYGKAYQISWHGMAKELKKDHPLNSRDAEHVKKLFNLGMEFHNIFQPSTKGHPFVPSRYAYFRDGKLFVMGQVLLKDQERQLKEFTERESWLEKTLPHYRGFFDYGPPLLADGSLDKTFIENFGLEVPANMCLALGDNHANSSDSRDFGFVPIANIRGSSDLIMWPLDRFGYAKPHTSSSRYTAGIWALFFLICLLAFLRKQKKNQKRIFRKLSS